MAGSRDAAVAQLAALCTLLLACGQSTGPAHSVDGGFEAGASLRINEVVARNQGVWIDLSGETDDYVELTNVSERELDLSEFRLADTSGSAWLPGLRLPPGGHVILWADEDLEQGPLHLPFKLSGDGETLVLFHGEREIDRFRYGAVEENEAVARFPSGTGEPARCRYGSPGRDNGSQCEPPLPPAIDDSVRFAPYVWPETWNEARGPLTLSELALNPARFIELHNVSDEPVELSDYQLWIAAHAPGQAWPVPGQGAQVPLAGTLEAGGFIAMELDAPQVAMLQQDPAFEGVVTLLTQEQSVIDRVDFMRWPADAVLLRGASAGPGRFCTNPTQGAATATCDPVPTRAVGDRLRALRTPGDYPALAVGGTALGVQSVKFVLERASRSVHLLSAARWPLHYTFVREEIDGDPPLNRCNPAEALAFDQGWGQFSQREYWSVNRNYLLGTLNRYAGSGLSTVEFTPGDSILADQMHEAFFGVVEATLDPRAWSLRPQIADQVERMQMIEGSLPIVPPNAPFRDLQLQPLTPGLGYGVLRFIPAAELSSAALGPDVIVVTDDVPNDIPLVGGLITEAFQTPLAHVNVLSQARNSPNMALRGARSDARLQDHFETLVRLEVSHGDFSVEPADPAQAEAFWESRRTTGPMVAPRLDTSLRGITPLAGRSLDDLPALGAKAAQLAELISLSETAACTGGFEAPRAAAAIPVVHSLEHFEASGAAQRLSQLQQDPAFRADPAVRAEGLAEVRARIAAHPVDPELLAQIESHVRAIWGTARVRFRSSSNTEDLPDFNGAGLYTSISGALEDPERRISDAIRTVWASLYNARAYDEREYARIDHSQVAMAILVHEAFLSEKANGVAISRNVLDPTRGDAHYINLQAGEASVTNPAPGVVTEQLLYNTTGRLPTVRHQSYSSLPTGPVLGESELAQVVCVLGRVHSHFRPQLDPMLENRWFAMEIEFKLVGDARRLMVKQARPYSFGAAEAPTDCREFDR